MADDGEVNSAHGLIRAVDDGKYCGKIVADAELIERARRANKASILAAIVTKTLACLLYLLILLLE